MPSDFWIGVAQTAIGSGLGFGLGICAFHYQQKLQSDKKDMEDWRAALDAINRLTTAAGANIEALVNAKLQFIIDLRAEVEEMKAVSEELFETPVEERARKIQELITVADSMRHFYLSFQQISVMLPPEFSEYSSLSKDMPALTLFVHRAMGMMREINERILSRNKLISEYARENGTGDGLSIERIQYFSSMLSGEGEAICEHADFALDFWRLVIDQIKAYKTGKGAGEDILEYKLVPKAVKAMPEEELFPLMREQMATFDNKNT